MFAKLWLEYCEASLAHSQHILKGIESNGVNDGTGFGIESSLKQNAV